MAVANRISELGKATRFGPSWPGKRCLAKTRKGSPCQRPAFKHNGRCGMHGGLSSGAKTAGGLKKISDANLKHGKYTKDKLAAKRHAAKVGRKVMAELKRIESKLDILKVPKGSTK